MPLICPTCQVGFGLTENANADNHLATVHGVVFVVLWSGRLKRLQYLIESLDQQVGMLGCEYQLRPDF